MDELKRIEKIRKYLNLFQTLKEPQSSIVNFCIS